MERHHQRERAAVQIGTPVRHRPLVCWRRGRGPCQHTVQEPRADLLAEGTSLGEEAAYTIISELGNALMVDEPQIGSGSVPPIVAVTDPRLALVRFHGRNRQKWYVRDAASSADRFDYLYSKAELAEWKPRVEQITEVAAEVHLLTNNNRSNYAIVNAFDLADLLQVPLPLPPPPPVVETIEQRERGEVAEGPSAGPE